MPVDLEALRQTFGERQLADGRTLCDFSASCVDDDNITLDVLKLITETEALRALVAAAIDLDHAAGCSGALSEQHLCKCGQRERLARAQAALGE